MSIFNVLGLRPYSRLNDNVAVNVAQPLLNELKHENFGNAELLLSEADAQSRELMIYGLSKDNQAFLLVNKWKNVELNSAWAHISLGAIYINIAWEIRGESYAEYVDDSSWTPFLNNLQNSEAVLSRAIELDRTLAEPYSWLLHALLGQGEQLEVLQDVFNHAIRIEPQHYPSFYKFHMAVTDKWEGSHELMFSFSKETSQELEAGNILHGLVAHSYSEFILSLLKSRTVDKVLAMMKQPQYANNIRDALFKWLNATPQNLSDKLLSINDPMGKETLNHFAMTLYATGAIEEAKLVFKALNKEIQSIPWVWIAQGIKEEYFTAFVFDRAYKAIGLKW